MCPEMVEHQSGTWCQSQEPGYSHLLNQVRIWDQVEVNLCTYSRTQPTTQNMMQREVSNGLSFSIQHLGSSALDTTVSMGTRQKGQPVTGRPFFLPRRCNVGPCLSHMGILSVPFPLHYSLLHFQRLHRSLFFLRWCHTSTPILLRGSVSTPSSIVLIKIVSRTNGSL